MAMRKMLAAAVAVMEIASAGMAQARTQPTDWFCHELARILEGATERPMPFRHIARGRARAPTLGFRYGCQGALSNGRPNWFCHQSLAPDHLSRASLAKRTLACLPEARQLPGGWDGETILALPHARISISESGGPGAHVGRIVTYVVEAR
jgi:hypothetical protein